MTTNTHDLSQLAENLRKAEAALQTAQATLSSDPKVRYFAEELHSMLCKSSHEDMCGWEWEKIRKDEDPWAQRSHMRYLNKALGLYAKYPRVDVADILGILEDAKKL